MTRDLSLLIFCVVALSACSYPTEQVRTLDERPSILISGQTPTDAVLAVDGLVVGSVRASNGAEQALRIEPGTHVVTVKSNGKELIRQTVFVSGNMIKTIALPDGVFSQ
jgi:hypothetical protein